MARTAFQGSQLIVEIRLSARSAIKIICQLFHFMVSPCMSAAGIIIGVGPGKQ